MTKAIFKIYAVIAALPFNSCYVHAQSASNREFTRDQIILSECLSELQMSEKRGYLFVNDRIKLNAELTLINNKFFGYVNDQYECGKAPDQLVNEFYQLFPDLRNVLTVDNFRYNTSNGGNSKKIYVADVTCKNSSCRDEVSKYIVNIEQEIKEWSRNKISMIQAKEMEERRAEDLATKARTSKQEEFANIRTKADIDTVSKVLNYSEGCDDEGCKNYFWTSKDKNSCIYEKIKLSNTGAETKIERETINLNNFDPQSISIQRQDKTVSVPDFFSRTNSQVRVPVTVFYVMHDGKYIFQATDRDEERLKRGWTLVYSKYCRGKKREF